MNDIERLKRLHLASRIYGFIALIFISMSAVALGMEAVPAATADQWLADPKTAGDAANTLAKHTAGMGGFAWSGIIGAGIAVLAGLRYVVPFIPYVGTAWKVVIDGAWNIAQHREAKQAEAAQAKVAQFAAVAVPAIKTLRDIYPDTWCKLPETVRLPLDALAQAQSQAQAQA